MNINGCMANGSARTVTQTRVELINFDIVVTIETGIKCDKIMTSDEKRSIFKLGIN